MSSSSTTTTTTRLLMLKASDGVTFEVEEAVATKLGAINNMVEEEGSEDLICLPNVNGKFLGMVLEWCKKHANNNTNSDKGNDEVNKWWDKEFVMDLDQNTLYHLLMAADYLSGTELVDLLTEKVASMIRGKKVEEIRETFKIKSDFLPGQEEEIRKKNSWAFE
ncbi:S-phase kinase-associated protein [Trema orientale]|uniref:SKP1-like protein n=1 Tax=Trema orientale TaxID=63057 RepID=A0A2P5FNH0_TREOI|nr:S-phase kinase-associated protein [Trema orientale]